MDQIILELNKISQELSEIKQKIEKYETDRSFEDRIPRKKLMDFFEYKDTQIAELLKSDDLRVAEIGNRKFIKRESVLKLLEKNIKE